MKTLGILAAFLLFAPEGAQARAGHADETILIGAGRSTVRIIVSEHSRDMGSRIRRLEMAVRDLQTRVYDLEEDPSGGDPESYLCRLKYGSTTHLGELRPNCNEAKISAYNICMDRESFASNCDYDKIKCEPNCSNEY